jgi:DnaK suppressor protein
MNSEEKQELKSSIEKKIIATEAAIKDYKDLTKPIAPDVAIGRLSRMDAINNKSVIEAALRESEAKLNRLIGALAPLDDPEFGIFSSCKKPIPFNRLKAMSDTKKCMNCAK